MWVKRKHPTIPSRANRVAVYRLFWRTGVDRLIVLIIILSIEHFVYSATHTAAAFRQTKRPPKGSNREDGIPTHITHKPVAMRPVANQQVHFSRMSLLPP